ncbi:hypothetical protein U8326_04075 [Tsuneonella sp. CC-YZS046]|uniref:Rossmann fold domain-containing protein n=1 Tax=Tsuneonella sp. CC-YZS046 TaxID=3042152 RepID=UPI002D779EDA|nr:hypothetical protein [Tsuneonella sp. CC-YZS046]WRO67354.1 hypothetical protein U8326_04075 [Tsuneonella sp. CC-YZS046]
MQRVVRIPTLPENPLQASADFYRSHLAMVTDGLAGNVASLAIVFPPASHAHRGWRRAVIANLAREFAPVRVNGIAGSEGEALAAALAWLGHSPGVTGQLLGLCGQSEECEAYLPDE